MTLLPLHVPPLLSPMTLLLPRETPLLPLLCRLLAQPPPPLRPACVIFLIVCLSREEEEEEEEGRSWIR